MPSSPAPTVIALRDVRKVYDTGRLKVRALRGVSLTVESGDFVAIMGASGSGKTTLMNILGCMDVPTTGRYVLDGIDVRHLDDFDLARIRNEKIGLVFQSYNLIARTSALRNVELPLIYGGVKPKERHRRAMRSLKSVGLAKFALHVPSELSGGMQQRVAIARAMVTDPAMILADEPTGALDSASSAVVMGIFSHLNVEGRTVVLITHEHDVAAYAKRVVTVKDGLIVADERVCNVDDPPPLWRGSPAGNPKTASTGADGPVSGAGIQR